MRTLNILISGAGVAGPALAYWLNRYGFKVTIVEQVTTIRDSGYAVDFRGNAIEVLRRMGILDEIKRAQTHMGAVSFVDKNNKHLADMPAIFLSGELEIVRGDLGKILYSLTKSTTEYIFGDSISSISETESGVNVTFKNNKPRTFDLLVGADGTHSKVRSLVFGEEARFVHHLGCCISIFTTQNDLNLDHTGLCFATPGKLSAIYSAREKSEAKVIFYFTVPKQAIEADTESQKKFVADTFANEGWKIPKFLKTMQNSRDFYFDTIDQVRMEQWSKGRIILLGDAGYCASPLSGAGTGLAIVGAYILAGELRRAKDDYTTAFANYEQAMRPYVKKAQALPNLLRPLMLPKSRWLLGLRITLLRTITFLKLEGLIVKLARSPSNTVRLEEYVK